MGVAANRDDSCTYSNEFAHPWLGRGRGLKHDDSYTIVFNEFDIAKENASAGVGSLRKALKSRQRRLDGKSCNCEVLTMSTISYG